MWLEQDLNELIAHNNTQTGDGKVVADGDFSMAQFFDCIYIINPLLVSLREALNSLFSGKKNSFTSRILVIKGECLNLRTLSNNETKHYSVRTCNYFP